MYEFIFITHQPAFYKVNLYNELAKHKKIFVFFISDGSSIRNKDFISYNMKFEYAFLNNGAFEKRNWIFSCVRLLKKLKKISAKKIVVGGWDLPEFWLSVICNEKYKNAVIVESSIYESSTNNVFRILKNYFLKMISLAYCSGKPHAELLNSLGYKDKIVITGGVGLKNSSGKSCLFNIKKTLPNSGVSFLYVGRLSQEKGVFFLIDFFRQRYDLKLTIVGDGPLKNALLRDCPENVTLLGYVSNSELSDVYQSHDIFILPSHSETWGLVVEEALHFGLPVVCSSKVGCNIDLVCDPDTGVIFDDGNFESLLLATQQVIKHYPHYIEKIELFNSNNKDKHQMNAYIDGWMD
ncbi:glycosyltransferase family 4 protein [Aeromonas veronii]|uniref:glycosyltransferase family 4 protein n=1 Tax=Aeromonas veronii TaxID=654 RepID=UPI003A4B967F